MLLPFEQRVSLPDGHYFVTDLIGCAVFRADGGSAKLGDVRDVFFPGEGVVGTPLLQVQTPGGELLIPLAVDICQKIDVSGKRIDVALPEGLQEVNQPD